MDFVEFGLMIRILYWAMGGFLIRVMVCVGYGGGCGVRGESVLID